MKNNFCESHLEEATLEWFADLGYETYQKKKDGG